MTPPRFTADYAKASPPSSKSARPSSKALTPLTMRAPASSRGAVCRREGSKTPIAPLLRVSCFLRTSSADPLVARQRRDIFPRRQCLWVRLQRGRQIVGQIVDHPAGNAVRAGHRATIYCTRERLSCPGLFGLIPPLAMAGGGQGFQYRNWSVIAGLMALRLIDPILPSPPTPAISHARVVRLSRLSAAPICSWKTPQLLNMPRRLGAGDGNLAELTSAIDGSPVQRPAAAESISRPCCTMRAMSGSGAAPTDLPRAGADGEGARLAIMARKEELYALNYATGSNPQGRLDRHRGGAGTSSPSHRRAVASCPIATCCSTARLEGLSKNGTFMGQHIYTSLQGVAVPSSL